MALTDTTNRIIYQGNGSTTTPYSIPFRFDDASWLHLVKSDATGTLTSLAISVDYTLTNSNITTLVAIPSTDRLVILRRAPRTQPLIPGPFMVPEDHEKSLDQLVMAVQDAPEGAFPLSFPVDEPASTPQILPSKALRSNAALIFDADGNPGTKNGTEMADFLGLSASVTAAANSATTATTQSGVASTQATAAASAAASASASASAAENSSTSIGAAETSCINAATAASVSATNAANSATSVAAALDSKLDKSAVIDDLSTGGVDKALSAEQGVVLKGHLDSLTPTTIADEAALYTLTGLTAGDRYKLLSDGSVREYRGADGTDAEFSSFLVSTTAVADATHGASFDGEPLAGMYHYNEVSRGRASHVKAFPSRANATETETMHLYTNSHSEVGIGAEPANINYFAYLNLTGTNEQNEEEFYSDYEPSVWSDLNGDPVPSITITKAPEATESNWLNVSTNTITVSDNRQKHGLNNLADGVLVLIKKHPLNSSGGLEKYSVNEAITNLDPVKLVGRDTETYRLDKVFYNHGGARINLATSTNTMSKTGAAWEVYRGATLAYSNVDDVANVTDVTTWTKASDGLVDPDFSVVAAPAANEQRWKTLSPTVHYQRLEADVDIVSTTVMQNVFDDFRPEYGAMYHLEIVVELVTPAKNGSGGFTSNFAKLETHGTSANGDDNIYTLRDRCNDPNSLPTTHVSANHLNQGNVALATKHPASTAVLISLTRTFERTVIGDLYVQTSQRVAEATPLTIKAGSYIHIIRR